MTAPLDTTADLTDFIQSPQKTVSASSVMDKQIASAKITASMIVGGFLLATHVLAIWSLFYFSIPNLIAFGIMYFVTGCLGITLCYHRLLTHRTYQIPKWLERVYATCGIIALQGSPAQWVGHHRMHHAGSDTPRDPHNAGAGFWHSHMGWLVQSHEFFDDPRVVRRYSRDILSDPYYLWLDFIPNQFLIQIAVGVLFYAIGGWSMVGWATFTRLVAVYHTTWLVNSAAHTWGYVNYNCGDLSRNNWWVALLTWGEGWHNNHHANETIANAGHKWWEVDVTMWIILFMEKVGLARHVRKV